MCRNSSSVIEIQQNPAGNHNVDYQTSHESLAVLQGMILRPHVARDERASRGSDQVGHGQARDREGSPLGLWHVGLPLGVQTPIFPLPWRSSCRGAGRGRGRGLAYGCH